MATAKIKYKPDPKDICPQWHSMWPSKVSKRFCYQVNDGWSCTRVPGHDGPHHAHTESECYWIWTDDGRIIKRVKGLLVGSGEREDEPFVFGYGTPEDVDFDAVVSKPKVVGTEVLEQEEVDDEEGDDDVAF